MAKKLSDSRLLRTKIEVMRELGGLGPVSALTGSSRKNTENWSRAAHFPSRYFLVMSAALLQRGLRAPPQLWGMVIPARRKQVLQAMIATIEEQRSAA